MVSTGGLHRGHHWLAQASLGLGVAPALCLAPASLGLASAAAALVVAGTGKAGSALGARRPTWP